LLLSKVATEFKGEVKDKKILLFDVKRTYFNAMAKRTIFVQLPPEMNLPGMCGRLNRCMYGTRDAGKRWTSTDVEALKKMGYQQGTANPCCFSHKTLDSSLVVHGDDFTIETRRQ